MSKVPSTTYLGVTLREDLRWEEHITGISIKASWLPAKESQAVSSTATSKGTSILQQCQVSKLEYAAIVWDPYLNKDITRLENVQ